MAGLEEKVEQYKAYLSKSFENPKEEKILYVFKKLDRLPISLDDLQVTGIGKVVNSFRKHEGLIGDKARQLVAKWKQLVSSNSTAPSSAPEPESVSQPGLQCETVSETTYGSHSGRVAHRLDEVSKLPYMDSPVTVKTEPSEVRVKEEPTDDKKSRSTSSLSKEKSRKRERSPDERISKKHKHSHRDQVDKESKVDLSIVKKEKASEGKTKVKLKHERQDVPQLHIPVKEEKPSPSASPYGGRESCDSEQFKDRTRDGSGRNSSHKSSKDHHRSKSSDRSSKKSDTNSKTSEGSKEKHHKSKDKSSSSHSTVTEHDKVRVKKEPSDKYKEGSSHSAKPLHKVKVEKPDKSMSPHPDFHNDMVKIEPVEDSSKKSRKADDKSRKTDDKSESRKHSSSKSTSSSGDKHSHEKVSSRSKEKHDSKKSESSKHTDKKHKSSRSSSSSKSGSNAKKPKPAIVEFDMFSMPNGTEDESDEETKDVKPVKKEKNWSIGKKGVMAAPPAPSTSAPPRLSAKVPAGSVPLPRQPISLLQDDILGALPEITPNYKPLPHIDLDDRRQDTQIFQPEDVGSKKNCRTLVYSGRRNHFLTSVPTLYNSCLQVLKDNVDALDYVGGVPYDILKPVLEICTSSQLYNIEDANPQFIGETDELWKEHCKKDFRTQKPEQFESWREMYIRCHDARDAKLKSLTATIAASTVKRKEPVRTTKLAYVDTTAKAPRDVARRQRMHGTAGPMSKHDPLAKLSSHRQPGQSLARPPIPRRTDPNTSTSLGRNRQDKAVKLVAPMMRKTLRFMKSLKRK